jgi:rod shape-determining protein MreC
MRNIFFFIRRFSTLLLFLFLQGVAVWMLFKFNRFHKTVGMGIASEVTGVVNTQVDRLDDYFHQGEENKRVHRMNDSLMNLLQANMMQVDSSKKLVVDSVIIDSTRSLRRYYWLDAKVVYNTVNFDKNYMQLNRGAKYGIKENMAVLNSDGAVVGQVVNTSPNFSQVMSLLHIQNTLSASLKKSGDAGQVSWDGKDPRFVQLKGIPRNVQIQQGDTVLTSRYSYNYPPDKIIGTVTKVSNDPATGFFLVQIRTAVNFNNVQQVFVVENLQRDEQEQLNKDTEKKIDQQKRTQ